MTIGAKLREDFRVTVFETATARLDRWRPAAFRYRDGQTFPDAFRGDPDPTGDGPFGGLLLGGIGTGSFGRDLHGHFSRWHLQPGFRRQRCVDAANLTLRWATADRRETFRLGTAGWDRPLPPGARSLTALWPVTFEHVTAPEWPLELLVESYSPVLARNLAAAALPVAFVDVQVRNTSAATVAFDMAFFWPNLLGWRPTARSSGSRGATALYTDTGSAEQRLAWPENTNAGNTVRALPGAAESVWLEGLLYERGPGRVPRRDMEGEWFLGAAARHGPLRHSHHACFQVTGDSRHPGARWSQVVADRHFADTGVLADSDTSWAAKPCEVVGGAVAVGADLAPGADAAFTFVLAWDLPLVEVGSGRTWRKAYTEQFGSGGDRARAIAEHALKYRAGWRQAIDEWHAEMIEGSAVALTAPRIRGALVNELYYLVDGGTFWVAGQANAAGLPEPVLGTGPHFALLEGHHMGYYFLATFDLWPHAMPLIAVFWPELNRCLFRDFFEAVRVELPGPRPFSRDGHIGEVLSRGKVPHDVGSPPGDPWHDLNDYQYAGDSNTWKDHNAMFLIGAFLQRAITADPLPTANEWERLLMAAAHMATQDRDNDGLPEHDAYGDSTWDGIDLRGPMLFSAGLTLAAYAAMAEWAAAMGDTDAEARFRARRDLASASLETHFWTGSYYRNATAGEGADWVFADGLFGILLAARAGLRNLLPTAHVRAHLQAVYAHNFKAFDNGNWGPALQAPPGGWGDRTGGIQIDEVLVGSAWSCVALMLEYDMDTEAAEIAAVLVRVLYEESGLQFRTPAAWTRRRTYRAPRNLRPLAIGYLLASLCSAAPPDSARNGTPGNLV